MTDLAIEILKQYGVAGLIVVSVLFFSGWIVHRILGHFMSQY